MGDEGSPRARRRGSAASDKALAFAVRDWKKIIFRARDIRTEGWLIGLDDYHYVVARESGDVSLVHKSCLIVEVTPTTLDDVAMTYPDRAQIIRGMAERFREKMLVDYLGQHVQPPRSVPA